MEDTGKKINYREHETPDPEMFPDISNVASANECTGLMYRVPINNAELESYQQLSPMEIPREMEDADDSVQALLHRHSKNAKEAAESVIEASGESIPERISRKNGGRRTQTKACARRFFYWKITHFSTSSASRPS